MIPIVEAVVKPQEITSNYEEVIKEDSESQSISVLTYYSKSAVTNEESLGAPCNDRILIDYDGFMYTLLLSMIQYLFRVVRPLTEGWSLRRPRTSWFALRLHPFSGPYEMSLFDGIVYYSFFSVYHGKEEDKLFFQELKRSPTR